MCSAFYHSTVGKKIIMAVTGLILIGFVVGHMVGNLKIFYPCTVSGACKIDEYAIFLRELGAHLLGSEVFLWIVRLVLLLSVILHVDSAIKLTLLNRAARHSNLGDKGSGVGGKRYQVASYESSTYAARTMALGGAILLLFIIVHILHLTSGHLHFNGFEHLKVQANVTRAFQRLSWVGFYVIAMIGLGLHLYHGVWSALQTLGIDSPLCNKLFRRMALVLAIVVSGGFMVVPLAIYLGIIPGL
jgi:succinate dehydrogenase / fumarate reductase cytochrome b subunit